MTERWFDRSFGTGLGPDELPRIIARLRSAPDRLEAALASLSPEGLILKPGGTWSAQENAGHLLDLEPLWLGRLEDLLAGSEELRPADLTNLKTHQAAHNDRATVSILREFRTARAGLVERLESLAPHQLRATALHPRLRQPMTMADLFFFVAEHDDHHLARIRELSASS